MQTKKRQGKKRRLKEFEEKTVLMNVVRLREARLMALGFCLFVFVTWMQEAKSCAI